MIPDYQTRSEERDGWQIVTIEADGICRKLKFRPGEVRYSITTGNPNGKGIHLSGQMALDGWLAAGELDDIFPGVAQFVAGWFTEALEVYLSETA